MASNKDILEAQRYNRRRLITSFVAGSPEGKEVEPQAPTRPFVIGAALAVVMLLVSVGLRFLYPGADTKQSAGLAVVSSSGARYYLQDGQWHPISNRTSARLLGDSSTGTMKISDTDLAKYSQGQALGIADAPEDVPSDKNHMTADWTSCAIAERTFTWIGNSSLLKSNGLRAARSAYVAPVGGTDSYIVSGSSKFRIPAAAGETVARLRERSGAKPLLALKCFAGWSVFPMMRPYLDGTTSSSLNEVRLGHEKFGGETHGYSVAWPEADVPETARLADKLIFNPAGYHNNVIRPLTINVA